MKFGRAIHYLMTKNPCLGPDEITCGKNILGRWLLEFEGGSFCRKNCLWRWAQDYINVSWADNSDFIEFLSYFRKVKEKHAKFLKLSILIINQCSAVGCLEKKKFGIFGRLEV